MRIGTGLLAAFAALLMGLSGCQLDNTTSPAASAARAGSSGTSSWYDATQMQNIERVAELLAEGLGDRSARAALHSALRESPWSEHKVILSEFLQSARGRLLVESAAIRSGTAAATIDRLVASLPPVDLYVPARQHRRSWRVSDQIAVVALADLNSPLTASMPGHARFGINRSSPSVPATALLLLGPAELKLVRASALMAVENSTVIEPDPVVEQGPMLMMCMPESCGGGGGGGGGGPPPNPDLRIVSIATSNIVDNNFPWEGNEFEFRATASNGVTQSPVVSCSGIPPVGIFIASAYCVSTLVHNLAPPEVAYVDVEVKETDGWPNPDDLFVDWLNPRPDALSHPPRVLNNGGHSATYRLYEWPEGLNCSPPSVGGDPFCNYVAVQFSW